MCYDAMGVGEHDGAGSDNAQNSGSFDGNTFLTFETGVNPAGHSFVLTFSIKTSATDAIVLASSNGAECRGAEWCQSDFMTQSVVRTMTIWCFRLLEASFSSRWGWAPTARCRNTAASRVRTT